MAHHKQVGWPAYLQPGGATVSFLSYPEVIISDSGDLLIISGSLMLLMMIQRQDHRGAFRWLSSPFRLCHQQYIPSCGKPTWDIDSHLEPVPFSTTERPMATAET